MKVGVDRPTEDKTIRCLVCGLYFAKLAHHLHVHGIDSQQYRARFKLADDVPLMAPHLEHYRQRVENPTRRWVFPGRSVEELKQKIKTSADELGKPPTKRQFTERYSSGDTFAVIREFGSWTKAIIDTGLAPGSRQSQRPWYNKDDIADMFIAFYEKTGHMPYARELHGVNGLPTITTVYRLFGGSSVEARLYAEARMGGVSTKQPALNHQTTSPPSRALSAVEIERVLNQFIKIEGGQFIADKAGAAKQIAEMLHQEQPTGESPQVEPKPVKEPVAETWRLPTKTLTIPEGKARCLFCGLPLSDGMDQYHPRCVQVIEKIKANSAGGSRAKR